MYVGADHNWLGLAELLIGVVGMILATIFYFRSKQRTQISYIIERTQLLGQSTGILPDEVSIAYRNKPITNLVKANVILWNSGNQTVKGENISRDIMIEVPDTSELLRTSILKYSLEENRFLISQNFQNENQVYVNFHYLEPRQGLNIELLYTGEITIPNLRGTIIGMPQGFRLFIPKKLESAEGWMGMFFYYFRSFFIHDYYHSV